MDTVFIFGKDRLTVKLSGEIDHHIAEGLRDKIDREMDKRGVKNLVLDFLDVTFMDSSGIGIVLGRYRRLSKKGGKVAIRNCSRTVKKIMEMSGIFQLMKYEGGINGR